MNLTIRTATVSDLPELETLDRIAKTNPERRSRLSDWTHRDTVLAAEQEGELVGYLVLNYEFFHRPQIEMLMVAPEFREQGIGHELIRRAEHFVRSTKLFVTTNQSNHIMQRLLITSGFRVCGFIEELDEGDPEIVFFRTLATPDPEDTTEWGTP